MFTIEQFWSLVRTLLQTAGAALVARGYLDDGSMQMVVGALMTLITTGYAGGDLAPSGRGGWRGLAGGEQASDSDRREQAFQHGDAPGDGGGGPAAGDREKYLGFGR